MSLAKEMPHEPSQGKCFMSLARETLHEPSQGDAS